MDRPTSTPKTRSNLATTCRAANTSEVFRFQTDKPSTGWFRALVGCDPSLIRYHASVKHAPLFIVILSVALPSCDKSEARRDAEERLRQLTRARVEAKHKADRQNATVADGVEYAQACEAAKAALSDAEHAGLGDAEQIAAQEFEALDRDLTKREAERAEALRAITERWSEEKSRIEADARASKNASIIRAEEDRARLERAELRLRAAKLIGVDPAELETRSSRDPIPSSDLSLPAGVERTSGSQDEPLVIEGQ